MKRRTTARLLGGVLAVALLGLGACSSGEGSDQTKTPSGLRDVGSPIADGLVVPDGARLAGAVFPRPAADAGPDDWSAYLVVAGDPFAAWEDLAGQVRGGENPAELAGSADACTWTLPDDAPDSGGGSDGKGLPVLPLQTEESPTSTTTESRPVVDPYLAVITITADAPSAEVDGLECSAAATAVVDGTNVRYSAHLRSGTRWPATLTLEATSGQGDLPAASTALRTSIEMQARRGGGPDLVPGPDPVPAGASDHVPKAAQQPGSEPGGPFGTEVNCFVDAGYEQLQLPPNSSFVAGTFDEGTVSVLHVDDAHAAIADIQRQTAGDGTSEDGPGQVETLTLADGGKVTDFSFVISAGGGGCGATSSPDGRFLRVSVHGD